jgi:hypothetical protein
MTKLAHHLDPTLQKALSQEVERFQSTKIPIITVSASYREDVKGFYGYTENEDIPDVVFSRAHYSMALGVAIAAWQGTKSLSQTKVDPELAYVVDPTNFVTQKDWSKITFTEHVGKLLARRPILKRLKDLIDQFARQKLPILSSIEVPIMQLGSGLQKPILSFHIAAGNLLAEQKKSVVQVITDPHVRNEYLNNAGNKNFHYCVFDEATKTEALEKAAILNKKIDPEQIIVTGPPIDPRIIAARKKKHAWRSGPLKLCLTTGGLGTNSYEIRLVLQKLLPLLRRRNIKNAAGHKNNSHPAIELMVYASTHKDIADMVTKMAKEEKVKIEVIDSREKVNTGKVTHSQEESESTAKLTLLYHPQIVDANELLITHAFPWADGFISKPSGDMAYDAAAAGCFLLTLQEWGEWEHNIRERFESLNIARKCQVQDIDAQLSALTTTSGNSQSWVEQAMNAALTMPKLYTTGAQNIIEAYLKIAKK